ncbi:FAD binding domain-containing protein [Xylariaceae sp. FL0016]|nr:FAD binding domain-containing protein [Xylariaceae sp. FL0016]
MPHTTTTADDAEKIDVLICGGGSAGLCAGVWLARCGIPFKILERRDGPLRQGQADGVQCRTVELFESFGLAEAMLREAYHVLEVAFWAPEEAKVNGEANGETKKKEGRGIRRTHFAADTEAGLSHMPHVILNQARVNGLMLEEMRRVGGGKDNVEYGWEVRGLKVDGEKVKDPDAYCVTVTAAKQGAEKVFRAKYVLGSDGAHSLVRKSLGFNMLGDSTDAVWGVMDIYPRTNFPDIRKKAVISSEAGSLIIIPREGDSLVRFYTEMEGCVAKDVTLEMIQDKARRIFQPYEMEYAETAWWSAYSIGQRLADHFHQDHRVFLGGDACHTHSPKAGQGMNVSLQDGYNLGWKLAAVLRGQTDPALLETYVAERYKTAAELIDFDREWTRLFSNSLRVSGGITPDQLHDSFVKAGRYTAGQEYRYNDSAIMDAANSASGVATGLTVGMRFPSAQVLRLCDVRAMQLVRALPADTRWHIVVFGGNIVDSGTAKRLRKVADGLEEVVRTYTPSSAELNSVMNSVLVLSSKRVDIEQEAIPSLFMPVTGKWKTRDMFKIFVDDEGYNNSGHGHAYKTYGIDAAKGALVIVRPDQYIAKICQLDDGAAVGDFFKGFLRQQK